MTSVLDPRIKSSLIKAQMGEQGVELITSQVREFLKECPYEPVLSSELDRLLGMSKTMWKALWKLQSSPRTHINRLAACLSI
jgi:hypothetical protein